MNVLMGIDALRTERVERALSRWGAAYSGRICAPAERAEWAAGPVRVAACLAVKECLIKAVGGRPHPFDWHALRVGGPAGGAAAALVAEAGRALGTALGVTRFHSTACAVGSRSGAALWGEHADLIVAVAVLVEEDSC
ncbi:hypothetical protein AB0L65_12930 [Nonomuraea sp. NPDC052116]|uniref:hypothetical protein n=1 Tax=Nonomuraea sp. NPDC052116 TaxID=3155665 RepID=UPI0034416E92